MSAAVIYFYSGELFIVPMSGHGGYFVQIEPATTPLRDPKAVEVAVLQALESSAGSESSESPKNVKSPVLKRLGLRSYRAFAANAQACFVFEDGGNYEVERWVRASDGRGFEPAGQTQQLSSPEGLGAAVLGTFKGLQEGPSD